MFVDAAHDTPFSVLVLVHAAGPGFLSFVTETIHFVHAGVVTNDDGFFPQSLLHVGSQSKLGIVRHISLLFDLVDLASHDGIDNFLSAAGVLILCLGSQFSSQTRLVDLLGADLFADVVRQLLRSRIAHSLGCCLVHDNLLVGHLGLLKHWSPTIQNLLDNTPKILTLLARNVDYHEDGQLRQNHSSQCGRHF